jgi:NAD(P)-dependent dehydrogenase (short-subunit alcohol dehydrogenase family)
VSAAHRALVTGASRGIGRAIAVELGARGYRLILSSRSTGDLEETSRLVVASGGAPPLLLTADLARRDESAGLIARATQDGGAPDIVVHVAGVAPSSKTVEAADKDWDLAMEVNATAAFVLCRAAIPHMIHQQWGRIIVVASTAGRIGYPYTAAYTASKHAVVGLVRALAVEHARYGITVNAACPGFTETSLLDDAVRNIVNRTGVTPDEAKRRLAGMSPQQRLIQPDEIARLVAFLASDESASINGQAVNIDGGAVTT